MNFGQALELMKQGKKVRRPEWIPKEKYFRIHDEFIKKNFPIKEKGFVKQKVGMIGKIGRVIKEGEDESKFSNVHERDCYAEWEERYVPVIVEPVIVIRSKDGKQESYIEGERLAITQSHIDLLAEDWEVVE